MAHHERLACVTLAVLGVVFTVACSEEQATERGSESPSETASGGASQDGVVATGGIVTSGGGSTPVGGTGFGGVTSTGGGAPSGSGGEPAIGGNAVGGDRPTPGGASGVGGSPGVGGDSVLGGGPNAGGEPEAGGSPALGGGPAAGGVVATGGIVTTGGIPGTGGVPATGGEVATGGDTPTGGDAGSSSVASCSTTAPVGYLVGELTPDVELQRCDGTLVSLRELICGNALTQVYSYAGWCPGCRGFSGLEGESFMDGNQIYERYQDDGFEQVIVLSATEQFGAKPTEADCAELQALHQGLVVFDATSSKMEDELHLQINGGTALLDEQGLWVVAPPPEASEVEGGGISEVLTELMDRFGW